MSHLLRVSNETLNQTVAAIRDAGADKVEAAVFWLGRLDTLEVDVIVRPSGAEVERFSLALRISERWMVRLAETCERLDRIVLGAVHSHPEAAFFSFIDADGFFHALDCISIVLPSYGHTSAEAARTDWGLYVGLPGNQWRQGRWDEDVVIGGTDAAQVLVLA
jgi:hypothetical protein